MSSYFEKEEAVENHVSDIQNNKENSEQGGPLSGSKERERQQMPLCLQVLQQLLAL